jgi:hypothetical protein
MAVRLARFSGGCLLLAALALALPGVEARACEEPGVLCSAEAAPAPPAAPAPAACEGAAGHEALGPAQRAQLRARLAAAAATGPAVVPLDANGHNYRAGSEDLDSVLQRIRLEQARAAR